MTKIIQFYESKFEEEVGSAEEQSACNKVYHGEFIPEQNNQLAI